MTALERMNKYSMRYLIERTTLSFITDPILVLTLNFNVFIWLGIEDLLTTHKKRYENNLGRLNVRNMVKMNLSSNVKKHAPTISVCSNDLDDEVRMVLDWSRRNIELAKEMDRHLKDRFNEVIGLLDPYVAPNQMKRGSHPRLFSVESVRSINHLYLENADTCIVSMNSVRVEYACSILTEVQSGPKMDATVMHESRLTQLLRKANISTNPPASPTVNNDSKKTVFIPSDFERDFLEFQQLNNLM